MMSNELSEYEKQRLENIRRNQEILTKLNIVPLIDKKLAKGPVVVSNKHQIKTNNIALPKKDNKSEKDEHGLMLRRSIRIQEKALEYARKSSRKKKMPKVELMSLEDLKRGQESFDPITRQRAVLGPIPFNPQVGATKDFQSMISQMVSSTKKIECRIKSDASLDRWNKEWTIALPHCITKVLRSRIYSIAMHPSTEHTLVAVGGKMGELSLWDASHVINTIYESEATLPKLDESFDFEGIEKRKFHEKLPAYEEFEPRVFTFQPHVNSENGSISNLRFLPSGLVSTSYDGTIRLMNYQKAIFEQVYRNDADERELIYGFDVPEEHIWWFSHGDGKVSRLDRREALRPATFELHSTKIGTVSVANQKNLLLTASNDRTIAIWDTRNLVPEESKPVYLVEGVCTRAVTSAFFNPNRADLFLSTCYDNHIRVHQLNGATCSSSVVLKVEHSCQTGKWITPFRAVWDPKHENVFLCADMKKTLNQWQIKRDTWNEIIHESRTWSPMLTSQPAVSAAHPTRELVCSGNASGKIIVYTPINKSQ